MAYNIEEKLVIAIASSALFDLSESDKIFHKEGLTKYEEHQKNNMDIVLDKGVAFPFIKRLLSLNKIDSENNPIEVILLSRNSINTGLRVFRSISEYNLDITRAAFFSGSSPYKYIPAYNASLFLSANEDDVKEAIKLGHPAGQVFGSTTIDDDDDSELRIAFDFDGVIASDESEIIYKERGIKMYHEYEKTHANQPLNIGPVGDLLKKISKIQEKEKTFSLLNPKYKPRLRTSIVTARNAPAHERVITTLNHLGIEVDEAFFMGNILKKNILDIMKPHIFFDDQKNHLLDLNNVPAVHIPFGVANKTMSMQSKKKEPKKKTTK